MILSMIFIAVAAVLNALMDKCETTISFKTSVFKKLNPAFWCKPVAAHTAKFIPGTRWRFDAWHTAKSAAGILVLCACVTYTPRYFHPVVDFAILLFIWIAVFNAFYNYVFNDTRNV